MLGVERFDLDVVDSTQAWMHRMWASLPRDRMTLVTAREQTDGRGRLKGRSWTSPRGNLYLTLTLFLDMERKDSAHLGQVAAVAVRQAAMAHGVSGKQLQLKWPNDLMLEAAMGFKPKKVGGILSEVFVSPPHLVCCIGVGLNVQMTPLVEERPQPVATLFSTEEEEAKRELKYREVADTVIERLVSCFNTFMTEGFSPFLHPYGAALMHRVGERLISMQGGKKIEGLFLGIDPSGALLLDVEGHRRLFVAGEWNSASS